MKDRFILMKDRFILGVDDTPDWFVYKVKNVYIPDLSKVEVKILYNDVIYTAVKGDCIGRDGDLAYIAK